MTQTGSLIAPYGSVLKELVVDGQRAADLKNEALSLPSWDLTSRQLCDIELLLNGGFSPLEGFMGRADYENVRDRMRLVDGTVWPIPITLDVGEEFSASLSKGDRVVLRHPEGIALAVLTVSNVWRPDLRVEAQQVYGTVDEAHPTVFWLFHQSNPVYVGGHLEGIELPPHHTFRQLRHTPRELRRTFEALRWTDVVAFQTRNPMHRAHVELTQRAASEVEARLLINPVVGMTRPGDVDYFVRVRCYQAVLKHYPAESTYLSLLPLAMRMGGPREAVWHAIIRRNYGCSHLIVGRDHAGPGQNSDGQPFYGPYDAQQLLATHADEVGIQPVTFQEMVYVASEDRYRPRSEISNETRVLSLSGTELRRKLNEGEHVPDWFSYPEVIQALRRTYPPRAQQGFTVFFTGLPSSGKSTLANVLLAKLMEDGGRPVTLLDGDLVRKHLSSELGFSKEHRDLNIKRIGYVASEITKNRGVAICAPIAPYSVTRREVREMIAQHGGFIEVYVATPLEVCEQRDRKGLYARARAGLIREFTGIDDPYEEPVNAEVVVDTSDLTPEEGVEKVLSFLSDSGYIEGEQREPG